jgi:hypothetical protein
MVISTGLELGSILKIGWEAGTGIKEVPNLAY